MIAEPRPVPAVGRMRAPKLPAVVDRTLPNGLRVVAARRSGVPRLEARLVIPTARGDAADGARLRVLARTLLSGTAEHSSVELAARLQALGGGLNASASAEDVSVSGSVLAPNTRAFLELLAEVIEGAAYPTDEVDLERDRVVQELLLARSQPETIAHEAFVRRLYRRHPYGQGLPDPDRVAKVTRAALRKLHDERLRPEGAVLVLVGDLTPARAADLAEAALSGWASGGAPAGLPTPTVPPPGAVLVIDRPGAVQTNIRMGGPALPRSDARYPALAVANLVFGGYFISRLTDNIREDKGYTYTPHSGVAQHRHAAHLQIAADVGTEVTAPALAEINYELLRMVAGPFTDRELDSAKRYLAGTLAMSIQTQAGLASYLAMLALQGLPPEYLRDYPRLAQAVTADEILTAARQHLAPRRLHTVLVGDAEQVAPVVEGFAEVEVQSAG